MAFTISFGNSGSTANMGMMIIVVAIFLYFTGLWRTVSNLWTKFFGSAMWSQTIGNAKATWNKAEPVPTVAQGSIPGQFSVPPARIS